MLFDHIAYLEKISRESTTIRHADNEPHFSISSGYTQTEELLQNLASKGLQVVAIDDISGSYDNNDTVNLYDTQSCSFMVLKHVPTIDDRAAISEARKECSIIARKIFSRMRQDSYEACKQATIKDTVGLRQLNQQSFRYFSVGPLADNYYGIDASFTVGAPEAVGYDPDDWTNLQS